MGISLPMYGSGLSIRALTMGPRSVYVLIQGTNK